MIQNSPAAGAAARIASPTTGRLPLSVNSTASPAAVEVGERLFIFYKGANDDPGIYITQSVPGEDGQQQWTDAQRLPGQVNTSDGPTALVEGSTIYLFYKGSGSDTQIWVVRSQDGGSTWYQAVMPNWVNTAVRPDVLSFAGSFYVVYRGSGNDQGLYIEAVPTNLDWQLIS